MEELGIDDWPAAPKLSSARLCLEPLRVDHAAELWPLFDDPKLHAFTGGRPATLAELRGHYQRQITGVSPDGSQRWLNWVVWLRDSHRPVGSVQATITGPGESLVAEVAWVIASQHQGNGYASEAAAAMAAWLRATGARVLIAYVHPQHEASEKVARALGLTPTADVVNGETRWEG